jgi:hypothetical protein
VVYEAGIQSCLEFAQTTAPGHYRKYMQVIGEQGFEAGHFSEGDIQYCIEYAKLIAESDKEAE